MGLDIDTLNSEWAAAPGTDDGALVGRNADSKVGFYGAAPVARYVLGTTAAAATAPDIAAALVALGLVVPAAA